MNFKLRTGGVIRLDDWAHIPNDPGNRDWQEYLRWTAKGNMPVLADAPPPRPPDRDVELDAAVEATTTWTELKAVLKGRVRARP